MKRIAIIAVIILFLCSLANGQTFSSGSTGADGPLDLTSGDRTIQIPESGILNYTTVNIPAGRTLKFANNTRVTPVYLLAQGNVVIAGTINVDGSSMSCTDFSGCTGSFAPGPGGFYGGQSGQPGFGPGQGTSSNPPGSWIGPLSLVPIIGGSGSYGDLYRGGAGGGAIVIASSTSISSAGSVVARGNFNTMFFGFVNITQSSSRGSGGSIRLVANSINVSGTLNACGGACGVIRLEAPIGALTFTGTSNPPAVLSTINPAIASTSSPSLTIVSIAGSPVPSYAGQRFDAVDILLPNQIPDPITVLVQGNNVPLGTQVSVRALNGSATATSTPSSLQGTFASSTASPTISGLTRTGVTYLLASATFDPPAGSGHLNQKGANFVDKIRIDSLIGAKPKFVFLRKDGSEIKPEMLAREFLQQFGQ